MSPENANAPLAGEASQDQKLVGAAGEATPAQGKVKTPAAIDYVRVGWAIVPIPSGKKGPNAKGWNTRERCVTTEAHAHAVRGNMGLAHAFSSTAAVDFDNLEVATPWLAERGIDAAALLGAADAVRISSGRPNRAKLLYRLPAGVAPLVSRKLADGALELRCASANGLSVQDVLPPSIHPDTGQPYRWEYGDELAGDWRTLPELPAVVLRLWQQDVQRNEPAPPRAPSGASIDELRERLKSKDASAGEEEWHRVLMILHHETGGSEEGLDLADEWSSRGSNYTGRESIESRWRSWSSREHPRPITLASLRVELPASIDDFDALPVEAPARTTTLAFKRNRRKEILAEPVNVHMALRSSEWCGLQIAFDSFRDEVMIAPPDTNEWRPLKDDDVTALQEQFNLRRFKPIPRDVMRHGLSLVASEHPFDSAILWLQSLTWDCVPRVERFLVDYCRSDDSPYVRAVALYLWTALAGRVLEPGCKADMAPILVGPQGAGKTSAVESLVPSGEHYVEIDLAQIGERDTARKMRGRLVGEIGELRGLGTKDLESIKTFITRREEDFVEKYKVYAGKFARRLIFIGTTNADEFLADETGNRRWLPVRVGKIDVDRIRADRLQLWAEARELWKREGIAWRVAESLAPAVHEKHLVTDSWEQLIERWLDGGDYLELGDPGPSRRSQPFTSFDVQSGALSIHPGQMTKGTDMRVAKVLKGMGFVRSTTRIDGKPRKVWLAA